MGGVLKFFLLFYKRTVYDIISRKRSIRGHHIVSFERRTKKKHRIKRIIDMRRRSSKRPGWLFLLLLLQTTHLAGADVLRTARVTVKEGTQMDELILDLVSAGQRLFPNDRVKRTFVQSTHNDIFDVDQSGRVRLIVDLDRGRCVA